MRKAKEKEKRRFFVKEMSVTAIEEGIFAVMVHKNVGPQIYYYMMNVQNEIQFGSTKNEHAHMLEFVH